MVVMKLLVNNRISEDCPEEEKEDVKMREKLIYQTVMILRNIPVMGISLWHL